MKIGMKIAIALGLGLKRNAHIFVGLIAGMIVGNSRIKYRKEIVTFMDGLTWLFQIIMFLCLGLLVNPHEMLDIAVVASLIGIFSTAACKLSIILINCANDTSVFSSSSASQPPAS